MKDRKKSMCANRVILNRMLNVLKCVVFLRKKKKTGTKKEGQKEEYVCKLSDFEQNVECPQMFRKEQMDLAPRVCNERLPEYSKNITIMCFLQCNNATPAGIYARAGGQS